MKSPSRLLRIPLLCSTGVLLLCTGTANAAIVATGESSARNLVAGAGLSGSLLGVATGGLAVGVGPINGVSDDAPVPYGGGGALAVGATAADSDGILSLSAVVDVDRTAVNSSVNGGSGMHVTNGLGRITDAQANFRLDLGGLTGTVDLLQVSLDSLPGSVLQAFSELTSDGSSTTPTMSTNLISTNATVIVRVLGLSLTVPVFDTAGLPLTITVEESVPLAFGATSITGTITLTPDWMDYNSSGMIHEAEAASLLVSADLNFNVPALLGGSDLLNVDLDASIAFNQVSAQIEASPVPEPSAVLLTALVGACFRGRRRRKSA